MTTLTETELKQLVTQAYTNGEASIKAIVKLQSIGPDELIQKGYPATAELLVLLSKPLTPKKSTKHLS